MIPKLQVTLSFAFCFLPQGKLYHLSVIKLCALTIWVVVNSSERHNRQGMFTKLTLSDFVVFEVFPLCSWELPLGEHAALPPPCT